MLSKCVRSFSILKQSNGPKLVLCWWSAIQLFVLFPSGKKQWSSNHSGAWPGWEGRHPNGAVGEIWYPCGRMDKPHYNGAGPVPPKGHLGYAAMPKRSKKHRRGFSDMKALPSLHLGFCWAYGVCRWRIWVRSEVRGWRWANRIFPSNWPDLSLVNFKAIFEGLGLRV